MPLWKRSADISLSLAVMPLLLAAIALMAIYHWLVSPGPIFFRQARIGRGGRTFSIYKFRTMKPACEFSTHQNHLHQLLGSGAPMEKLDKGDARIIPGGRLLRASGLDELPQLLNVLRGEMSLIGPRPCLPFEYEAYAPDQRKRFEVAPGLTGLWQVSGKNRTTFEQMVQLDCDYVERRSAGLDLKIVFLTIPALVQQIMDTQVTRVTQVAQSLAGHAPLNEKFRPAGTARLAS
jgi:lipopolysaccharide/colanic/teichoic acid biosynthesis glycosyltransferase